MPVIRTCALVLLASLLAAEPSMAALRFGGVADVKAARLMFTEAAFGWCADKLSAHPFVPTALDPAGAGWSDGNQKPSKAAKGALSRVNDATGVMVELNADRTRCYVQVEASGGEVLATALRELVVLPPLNGVLVNQFRNDRGQGGDFAVRAGKGGPVLAVSINNYADNDKLVTAVIRREPDGGGGTP